MAERRMFAKTIIDSDAFLDMPLSTQSLYFHLSMRADDEGFINNQKKIQRMIGASDDDMRMLLAKKFIIAFESGVIVIKHWKIHNYIRQDRMTPTKYQEEKKMLVEKETGTYSISDDIKRIDAKASDLRKEAYAKSSLPYSFDYKIRHAFHGAECPICGSKMNTDYCKPSIQHNIPISKGGKHEIDNISVICLNCNVSIQDKETGDLNNYDVVQTWDQIVEAEKAGVDWFYNTKIVRKSSDGQMSGRCRASDGQMSAQDRIGKERLGEVSVDVVETPTREEVITYIISNGISINPDRFYQYYSENNWCKPNGKPVTDWKQTARNWEKNCIDQESKKKNSFNNFNQRKYDFSELEQKLLEC